MKIAITKNVAMGVGAIALLILVPGLLLSSSKTREAVDLELLDGEIVIFKSQSCGCCGLYSQYLTGTGFDVKVNTVENLNPIKEQYSIPYNLQSCHTSIVGNYFVEGHIPVEAITKLLTEKPDIAGIAMPGMPSGSPGMPGTKTGPFVIYAVGRDGSTSEFMRI